MKRTSFVVMAAGLGSRFGGVKQLEPVGNHGEILMDYSIHDALEAGFDRIIFVIRREMEADFRVRIGYRIEELCKSLGVEIAYAWQELWDLPEGFILPEGRKKPWGTGHAVLAARDLLQEPFMVLNADDYYGKQAITQMHEWLIGDHLETEIAMAGFMLKNTLSDHGGVTRGLCTVDASGTRVLCVAETRQIIKTSDGAEANGIAIDPEQYVSMNLWGFSGTEGHRPVFLQMLENNFRTFLREEMPMAPLNSEYLLPIIIGELLRNRTCTVQLLKTEDHWFGMTHREDMEMVRVCFRRLIEKGVYPEELYSDLLKVQN